MAPLRPFSRGLGGARTIKKIHATARAALPFCAAEHAVDHAAGCCWACGRVVDCDVKHVIGHGPFDHSAAFAMPWCKSSDQGRVTLTTARVHQAGRSRRSALRAAWCRPAPCWLRGRACAPEAKKTGQLLHLTSGHTNYVMYWRMSHQQPVSVHRCSHSSCLFVT